MANRALVTGGAGFIGSHLCERLLQEGQEVICLDNFYTGTKAKIGHLLEHPSFEMICHDVVEPLRIEADQIYHLACPASPVHYQRNPIQTLKTSLLGTINMLELAKEQKAKILFSSTSEVYGDPQIHPQAENYWGHVNPVGVRSCYDEGKRAAESLCYEYHRQFGLDAKIIRIFNTYGPKMNPDDGRVVSNFIVKALKDEPITIYGNGTQTRSFCYVSELVEAMVKMMHSDQITGPVNLGNPAEISVLELAKKVLALTGSQSQLVFQQLPQDDPQRRCPDIRLARTCLGWEPQISIELGLRETIAYFKSILQEKKIRA